MSSAAASCNISKRAATFVPRAETPTATVLIRYHYASRRLDGVCIMYVLPAARRGRNGWAWQQHRTGESGGTYRRDTGVTRSSASKPRLGSQGKTPPAVFLIRLRTMPKPRMIFHFALCRRRRLSDYPSTANLCSPASRTCMLDTLLP